MATIYTPVIYGDTSGDLGDHVRAPAEDITLPPVTTSETLVGDANALLDHATGGDNTLSLTTQASGTLVGDAIDLEDHAHGGGNDLSLFALFDGEVVGDAIDMSGYAQGGDNTIDISGGLAQAIAIGDAETMSDHAAGGGNVITGTGNRTPIVLMGDAITMTDHASGGHNTLTGDEAGFMYGDAETVSGYATGGGNTLIDATQIGDLIEFPTYMYGDGQQLLGHASGGGNTLVSGFGADIMWGSAATVGPDATVAPDLFVFSPPNGQDQIMDFRPGIDHIELKGYGFSSFQQLANDFHNTPAGTLISFDPNDSILVAGVHQLASNDFIFG